MKSILDRLEFLVVQDLFAATATAAYAHPVLPAAGWDEEFINAERRIGRTRRVADPPGEARSDFDIVRLGRTLPLTHVDAAPRPQRHPTGLIVIRGRV